MQNGVSSNVYEGEIKEKKILRGRGQAKKKSQEEKKRE